MTEEMLALAIQKCKENAEAHGFSLQVTLEPSCHVDRLRVAEATIGESLVGSYRHFLEMHDGLEMQVVEPGRPAVDALRVLSVSEMVRSSLYVRKTLAAAAVETDRPSPIGDYISCAMLVNADVMLDISKRSAASHEPPAVVSRPGDLWMQTRPFPHVAPSFDAWLAETLGSMGTSSFGFDYLVEVPLWEA